MPLTGRRLSRLLPFLFALLFPRLALSGQTSRSAPVPTGPAGVGGAVSLPAISLPSVNSGLSVPNLSVPAFDVPSVLGADAVGPETVGRTVVPSQTALPQGFAPAAPRIQAASSPEAPAGPGAYTSSSEKAAEPLKAIGENRGPVENSASDGQKLEAALTGERLRTSETSSDGGSVRGGGSEDYVRLRGLGLRPPVPNPAELYEHAFELAAQSFAEKGVARADVRFGGVTGNTGGAEAQLHFSFFASKTEDAKNAPVVYVDYAPRLTARTLKEGARVSGFSSPVPTTGALFAGVSEPYYFAKGAQLAPEAALDAARAKISSLARETSFGLRYEKDAATGDLDPIYRFYDSRGNVAAVNARTGAVTVVVDATPAPMGSESDLSGLRRMKVTEVKWIAAIGTAMFNLGLGLMGLVNGVAFGKGLLFAGLASLVVSGFMALVTRRARELRLRHAEQDKDQESHLRHFWAQEDLRHELEARAIMRSTFWVGAASVLLALGLGALAGGGLVGMTGMLAPRKPLPNPVEYYEDAYEYAVMRAEKLGYSRADVRFGGVTGTLPVPAERHLMFTFYAVKSADAREGAHIYVDYAPRFGVVRGRMGSVAAYVEKAPLEAAVHARGNTPAEFAAEAVLSPDAALDKARAEFPALEPSVSFKQTLSPEGLTYSFYDSRGNHATVGARDGAVRVVSAADEPGTGTDWRPYVIVAILAILAALAIAHLGVPGLAATGMLVGGAFGVLRDEGAFAQQMQTRFGRMRGVTSVSVESDKRTRVVIEFGDRGSLEKAKAGRRIPGRTQNVPVVIRLNAQAQKAERDAFSAEAKKRFGILEGLEKLSLDPETGDARGVVLEFKSQEALDAAKAKGLPAKLDRLYVHARLTDAAAEAKRQAEEKARLAKEAAEKERRAFAARLRKAFPDVPGFVRASRADGKILVEGTGSYPASFEGLPVVVKPAPAAAVSDAEVEAAVASLVRSKGRPWSATEYAIFEHGALQQLRERGASEWQLARFADLEAAAPVIGGSFNPWSGD